MTEPNRALYRLEFKTDLTSSIAPVIDLGYMLEAAETDGFRFLGLASRESFTPLEQDRIDLATWPELGKLDGFMESLFTRAWGHVCEAAPDDLRLGCAHIASEYSVRSALRFRAMTPPEIDTTDRTDVDALHLELYRHLIGYGNQLRPALTAPVVPIPAPRRKPMPSVVFPKFRAEAGSIAA